MNSIGLPNVERAAPRASGLEGVVVADTRLSHVDGERGELFIAGSRVEDLALASPRPLRNGGRAPVGLGSRQVTAR